MERSTSPLDERAKIWKRLLETSASFEVKSLTIVESEVFAPQKIDLRRVLAFIGLHGTGKTLLLRLLEAAFGRMNQVTVPPFISGDQSLIVNGKRIYSAGVEGIIDVEIQTSRGPIIRRVDLSEPDSTRRQLWAEELGNSFAASGMSPLYLFQELTILYQDFHNAKMIQGVKAKNLSKPKLRAINNILGRTYGRVSIHSMDEDPYYSGMYVPYVTALLGDRELDSSMMSQGELWVHYVLNWFLESEIEKGDLVLLDEPEVFLATRAHRPLIDQVARQVLDKNAQLIISTHSPNVLTRFPLDNIRMCIASTDGIQVIRPTSTVQIRESIGLETPTRMLVLVEDELAKEIVRSLFVRFDRALTREVEIIPVDGEGEVQSGLRVLKHMEKLACLGILDGDRRGKQLEASQPVLFLPGTSFPENELLSAANRDAGWTAERMGVGLEDLLAAISSCRGLDHQYWVKTLARQLGFAEPVLTHELIQVWMRNRKIEEEGRDLVRSIRSGFLPRR